jgi:hypothetical protein
MTTYEDARAIQMSLGVRRTTTADATVFLVIIPPPGAARTALARSLAVLVVESLAHPSDTAFREWIARFDGGPVHSPEIREEIEAYVLPDFRVANSTRLQGSVVEHLWALLATRLEGEWGSPLRTEHHHFSVIDHGGDGFSFYEIEEMEDLRFRLWESKAHLGQQSVTTVVTMAAKQIKGSATEYLARASKELQLSDDPRVAKLAGTIVRLWSGRDEKSAAGISVGTEADTIPLRAFKGIETQLELSDFAQREGLVIQIEFLVAFCEEVRGWIMKGIE